MRTKALIGLLVILSILVIGILYSYQMGYVAIRGNSILEQANSYNLNTTLRNYPRVDFGVVEVSEIAIGPVKLMDIVEISDDSLYLTFKSNLDDNLKDKAIIISRPTIVGGIGRKTVNQLANSLEINQFYDVRVIYSSEGWNQITSALCNQSTMFTLSENVSECISILKLDSQPIDTYNDIVNYFENDELWLDDKNYWIYALYPINGN